MNETDRFTERWCCPVCTADYYFEPYAVPFCPKCQKRYPPALLKACGDPFNYALRLRTGEVIQFEAASIHGEYATLYGQGTYPGDRRVEGVAFPCPRGVDVRIADIVWCADAPQGS